MTQDAKSMLAFLVLAVLCPVVTVSSRSIPEPPTVVYGRICRVVGGRELAVTAGTFQLAVRPLAGADPIFSVSTEVVHSPETPYSYRLAIPHEARVLGKSVGSDVMPLEGTEALHELVDMTLDGEAARPMSAGDLYVALSQQSRAAAIRLDVVVAPDLTDSDGDGMPDCWEQSFGLDPDGDDADADADADGISNSAEYARGTAPDTDNRRPALMTARCHVYALCRTGLILDIADSDTAPDAIRVTMTRGPAGGRLLLGIPGDETPLRAGDDFTLADVDAGHLVFQELSGTVATRTVGLRLSDGTVGHDPVDADLALHVYRPLDTGEERMDGSSQSVGDILTLTGRQMMVDRLDQVLWLAGRFCDKTLWAGTAAHTALDFSCPAEAGLVGSAADDRIAGSSGPDILCGGPGADVMAGKGGADVFVFQADDPGPETIEDFSLSEGDVLDFSAVCRGESTAVSDYLTTAAVGGDLVLHVDANGDDSGYDDSTIVLAGRGSEGWDAESLWRAGHILVAGIATKPVVTISVSEEGGEAAETGPTSGGFVVRREGDRATALTVNLTLAGSATNGVDYQRIPSTVSIPAGALTAVVEVRPLTDYDIEATETVELSLVPGDSYAVGSPGSATVRLLDLEERITVEAMETGAFVDTGQAGTFAIRRSGMMGRPTEVWLDVTGSAAPGTDVQPLPNRVSFSPWQRVVYLDVIPLASAEISGVRESVVLSVRPDPAGTYRTDPSNHATVWLYTGATAAADTNGDGIPDAEDPDSDGLTTDEEIALGSDPTVPTLVLEQGWNMVSVPGLPEHSHTLAGQLGETFDGIVWTWEAGHYVLHRGAPLQPGRGYLVMVTEPVIVDLHDCREHDGVVSLEPGWNVVGTIRGGRWPSTVPAQIHEFVDGEYRPLDDPVLRPLTGYWVHVESGCTVDLP